MYVPLLHTGLSKPLVVNYFYNVLFLLFILNPYNEEFGNCPVVTKNNSESEKDETTKNFICLKHEGTLLSSVK